MRRLESIYLFIYFFPKENHGWTPKYFLTDLFFLTFSSSTFVYLFSECGAGERCWIDALGRMKSFICPQACQAHGP